MQRHWGGAVVFQDYVLRAQESEKQKCRTGVVGKKRGGELFGQKFFCAGFPTYFDFLQVFKFWSEFFSTEFSLKHVLFDKSKKSPFFG